MNLIIVAIQKIYFNIIHFSKLKKLQFENLKNLNKTFIYHDCNVIKKLFYFIIKIINCK